MAFANQRPAVEKKAPKRSPLAGWLGRKNAPVEEEALPEIDIVAGVNRALKGSRDRAEKPERKLEESPVREALGSIEAVLFAIDRVRDSLEQACEVALSAKDVDDAGGRALLAERYDELRLGIDVIIGEVDPRAATLIGANHRHLDVRLGGKTRYSVSSSRLDTSAQGLGLSPPADAFATIEEIDASLEELDSALARADRAAAGYCRDAQYLIARMNGAFE